MSIRGIDKHTNLVYDQFMYKKLEKPEKPRCPQCGSGEVYYRQILKEFICRRCGHSWKK
ncbi:hypothetical protein KKE60_07850 [Patescibacteria group bacterium]|nr:hypothetical protein [Patescibacteria group bacterium]